MSAPDPPDVDRLRAALARLGEEDAWPDADSERVFSALHGDMSPEERRDVIDELIQNPRAAAAWRLARELEPERTNARSPWRPWAWLPIAATLALLAGAVWQFGPWRAEAPVYRGEPRTIAPALAEDGRLSRTEPVLRWTAIEGARYHLRVMTPALEPLADVEPLDSPEYRLPPDVIGRVPPGGNILWQVEARVRGTSSVMSPTFTTQLK